MTIFMKGRRLLRMYKLDPASLSYEEGKEYSESEIIWWAEDVAEQLNQESYDITLFFDREHYAYIDINLAIEVLEKVDEYVEPVIP